MVVLPLTRRGQKLKSSSSFCFSTVKALTEGSSAPSSISMGAMAGSAGGACSQVESRVEKPGRVRRRWWLIGGDEVGDGVEDEARSGPERSSRMLSWQTHCFRVQRPHLMLSSILRALTYLGSSLLW